MSDPLDDLKQSYAAYTESDHDHFDKLIGLYFDELTGEQARGHVDIDARHQQPYGIVHGGVYAAIVESLASLAAANWAADHDMICVGVSNSTDFIRAHREGRLDAVATPVHRGRNQQLWQVEITREDGTLVARGQVRLQNLPSEVAAAIGG